MNGDPVEESGQALRQGFFQGMQSAAMTMNVLQRRASESRSVAEFARREADAERQRHQDTEIHDLKVTGYEDRQRHERQQHLLEMQVKQRQIERGDADLARRDADSAFERANKAELHGLQKGWHERRDERTEELHELEKNVKQRQIERGDTDLQRRTDDAAAARSDNREFHRRRIQSLAERAEQEKQRHDLDVEFKQLLIEIRRRAAGFTDTLTTTASPQEAATMRAAAEYAAAHSTAGLSDAHAAADAAYAERYTEDTGTDPDTILDAELVDLAPDVDLGPDLDSGGAPSAVSVDAVRGLAEELTAETYLEHLAATDDPGLDLTEGSSLADAIDALDLPINGPGEVDLDVQPTPVTPAAAADREVGP
ncbi:hypothetical protein BJY24_005772 [Nocardia transvalensis]|uniref:Uncharacterized protein n=1 Tax=Nocardia transvalensis TaxID=37333 RepID=A0A7W9ULM0_9NOCA|nr:hypothetical protein [Nocardia transvalensis]MBB5916860.1 hypothetical protein [Nocardia transvalensis]